MTALGLLTLLALVVTMGSLIRTARARARCEKATQELADRRLNASIKSIKL